MTARWTLAELVGEVAARLAALPPPANGQVRAVPDERTIRYYAAIGLLDRPADMRGRTALYGARHLAQIVAIKRLQAAGRTLADVQALWPTLDDATLARMSGVALPRAARKEFWKPAPGAPTPAPPMAPTPAPGAPPPAPGAPTRVAGAPTPMLGAEFAPTPPVELRLELAPGAVLVLALPDDLSVTPADVRAIRAAAGPLIAELARRRLATNTGEAP